MPAPITHDLDAAIAVLRRGGLVAIPTETVYGLAAHALDPRAVARIFEAKNRPHFDPLIVHIADPDQLPDLVTHVPPIAQRLMDAFWPGPLTLVLPRTDRVPDLVTAGLPSVAVRMPDHPVARDLLNRSRLPLAAPSANLFGRISPTTAEHVADQLADRIDLILDGGPCRIGLESTIVHVAANGRLTLLRPGGIPVEAIEPLTGPLETVQPADDDAPQLAPGMLTAHYAPRKPTTIVTSFEDIADKPHTGILALTPPPAPERFGTVEALSPTGDLATAAANLFAALRRLDASNVKQIAVQLGPETGLGRAINDRLRRASR